MKYLEIKLWKCNNLTKAENGYNNVKCKNKTEIDNYFRDEAFNFAFVNSIFDVSGFEQPVQQFIDDSLFFELDPNVSKKANFFV
jgi:hypothetical protein